MSELRQAMPSKHRALGEEAKVEGGVGRDIPFIVGLAFGVVGLLAIAAMLMYQSVYADRIFLGVSALGVDLGGDTKAEARSRVAARLEQYARLPVTLRYAGKEWKATPFELGMRFDADKIVNAAFQVGREGGFPQNVGTEFSVWRGGTSIQPSFFSSEQMQQDSFFSRLARQIDQQMMDARIIVQPDLQVRIASSQDGRKLSPAKTAQLLEQAFTNLSTAPIDLVVEESQPKIVDSSAQEAKAKSEKMLSAPLVLRYGESTWTMQRKEIQGMIAFAQQEEGPGKAKLVATFEEEKLKDFITKVAAEVDKKPQNARFDFSGGKLAVIRESKDGLKVDIASAMSAVKGQAATDQKTVVLPVNVIKPSVASQDAGPLAANFRDKIEEVSTSYGGTLPERVHNVELAAKRLHGIVVSPGEIFSFNDELGAATLDAGFKTAWGIILREGNMQTVPAEAGGICQVSTTLFQAVFWAGYQIEERLWHLYWIPRYGVAPKGFKGLDSTVDPPYVDLKFKNNTSNPILIQTKTDGKNISFALYGQKPTWQVKIDPPIIENVVKASTETVKEEDPTQPEGWSLWVESAQDGFKSTIVRTVTDGGDKRVLRLISDYRPSRNVLRVGTKKPDKSQPVQPQPGAPTQPQQPAQGQQPVQPPSSR